MTRPLGIFDAPLTPFGWTRGQARGGAAGRTESGGALELLFWEFFPGTLRGPLNPRRLLTYVHSKLFEEHRVHGTSPSHFRCLLRHWTQAEGTVVRSLLTCSTVWFELVDVLLLLAMEGCLSPIVLSRLSELGDDADAGGAGAGVGAGAGAPEAV